MILERLNIVPGKYTIRGCIQSNKRRLMFAAINAKKETKARRNFLRGLRKKKKDRNIDLEGRTYGSGAF